MKSKPMPDTELLREYFNYDKDTGILTWLKRTSSRALIGYEAGTVSTGGYLQVRLHGKVYTLARVIWKIVTGLEPLGEIDHINRNRADNRWENLRDVTHQQNRLNTNAKGYTQRPSGWYEVRVQQKYVGTFDTPEEASLAYELAREKVLNDCVRCGD